MDTTTLAYGAQSMTDPLVEVLVKRPGPAFGRAFDDPAHGFLHPVDLDVARREHDAFTELLASLGPTVHELDAESESRTSSTSSIRCSCPTAGRSRSGPASRTVAARSS